MEDQGKRLLLAVVLALGVVVLWNVLWPSSSSSPTKPPEQETTQPTAVDLSSPAGRPQNGATIVEAPTGTEEVTDFHYPHFDAEFSNRDARLVSWRLTDAKYARDENKGEMVDNPDIGQFQTNFLHSPVVIPEGATWTKLPDEQEAPNTVTYTFDGAQMSAKKVFLIHPDDSLVDISLEVTLKTADKATEQLAIRAVGHQNKNVDKQGRVTRETRAACFLNGDVSQMPATELAQKPNERSGDVRWVGFNHPYLFLAIAPRPNGQTNVTYGCNAYSDPTPGIEGGMEVDLVYPTVDLSPGAPFKWSAIAFIGSKHLSALEHADDVAQFSTAFDKSVNMGWFSIIARPLLWVLLWLQRFVGNWGVSIILLTVCVKAATLYWTTKSMRSMKAMSSLRPQIEAINKKFGEDKSGAQQATMALYKANGVNPLSGCLPMVLQMPIWLALYKMLSSAGELYLTPFIPGWINDLTATDPFHILPVALIGMMFLQSKLSPAAVDSTQQKIMIYGMPLIFGFMSFFFPAGLTIYIFTNTTLSMFHSLYMRKWDKGGRKMPKVPVPAASAPLPKAKVIDVDAEESKDDDSDDDSGDEPAAAAAAPQRSNAQRRKRKRRH